MNTHAEFAGPVREKLREATGVDVQGPADPFEAQANRDALVELSGALKVVAVSLTKIANDLVIMGSGPRTGFGELALPELQKSSSIMPGKVNPVIPEVVLQVAAQVIARNLLEAVEEVLTRNAESTPAIATALNPYIGYDKATEIVKEAVASRRTIREVAIEKGVDEATLDEALDLRKMARGSLT